MRMKLVAFAFLFTFTVNGQASSLAAATQSTVDHQPAAVQSDSGQRSLLAMLVGLLTPADVRHAQQDNEVGSYVHQVDSDETSPAPSITPMTSITIDTPQGQPSEIEKETVRLEQLLEQLTAKEKELSLLREKTAAAANQVNVEKTRAEALEAQLTQKEQELAGLCTQRDTHQHMSQELNRTRSSLELARQQVFDIERQFATNNDQLDTAMQRIADLDLQLVAKEQEFQLAKKLASALQDELKRGTVVLEQRGDKLTLALSSGELFAKGRVTMTPAGTTLVKRIGVALRKFRPQSVEVAGHTDSTPVKYDSRRSFKDNGELSQARAENAGKALIKGGLGADRVRAVGYADARPIATNDTEEGRSKNRRVEIVVIQSAEPIASTGETDEQVARNALGTSQYGGMVKKVANR